jgi:hypothetical protein
MVKKRKTRFQLHPLPTILLSLDKAEMGQMAVSSSLFKYKGLEAQLIAGDFSLRAT